MRELRKGESKPAEKETLLELSGVARKDGEGVTKQLLEPLKMDKSDVEAAMHAEFKTRHGVDASNK